jgi:hypothetical protein
MEQVTEEVALNLALVQTEEMFRERVRVEFFNLINTDSTIKAEVDRRIERQMRFFKQALMEAIPKAIDQCMYPDNSVADKQRQMAKQMMEQYKQGAQ